MLEKQTTLTKWHTQKISEFKMIHITYSLYTKDRISSLIAHVDSVSRTTYVVHTFKNPWQISDMVCTKQMVIAPFHKLFIGASVPLSQLQSSF